MTKRAMTRVGDTLSKLKQTLPAYSIVKDKVALQSVAGDKVLHALKDRHAANGRVNTDDGVKLDFADYWVHLRKSNTEPIVRIIAEARTRSEAENVVELFKKRVLSFQS